MRLQIKEIVGTDCEAFTKKYANAEDAYKVLSDMREHLFQTGYTVIADTKNHLLVEKTMTTGVKVTKSLLIFE